MFPGRLSAILVVLTLAALVWLLARMPVEPIVLAVRFEPDSGSGAERTIADGMTIEVTRLLATVEGLDVRTAIPISAYRYTPSDLVAFGAQRKATVVLAGTVRRDADRWTAMDASLLRVRDGVSAWYGSFPVAHNDLLATGERIAEAVARELNLAYESGRRAYRTTPALQERFLTARALQATPSDGGRMHAADLFEQISREDPAFVPALAALATTVGAVRPDSAEVPVLDPRMAAAARKAHQESPELSESHFAMGLLSAQLCQWHQAKTHFIKAIELDSSASSVQLGYAISTLLPLGERGDAVSVLRSALQVDPLSIGIRHALAQVLIESRELEAAIEISRALVKDAPELESASQTFDRAMYLSGRLRQPVETFSAKARWAYRGYVLAALGRRDEAARLAAEHPREPARQMLVYAGLDDRDRAFDALQRTARTSPWRAMTWMQRIEIAPVFRGDSRAAALRERLLRPADQARCGDGDPFPVHNQVLSGPVGKARLASTGS